MIQTRLRTLREQESALEEEESLIDLLIRLRARDRAEVENSGARQIRARRTMLLIGHGSNVVGKIRQPLSDLTNFSRFKAI